MVLSLSRCLCSHLSLAHALEMTRFKLSIHLLFVQRANDASKQRVENAEQVADRMGKGYAECRPTDKRDDGRNKTGAKIGRETVK